MPAVAKGYDMFALPRDESFWKNRALNDGGDGDDGDDDDDADDDDADDDDGQ